VARGNQPSASHRRLTMPGAHAQKHVYGVVHEVDARAQKAVRELVHRERGYVRYSGYVREGRDRPLICPPAHPPVSKAATRGHIIPQYMPLGGCWPRRATMPTGSRQTCTS
jgi:hypothetical protein